MLINLHLLYECAGITYYSLVAHKDYWDFNPVVFYCQKKKKNKNKKTTTTKNSLQIIHLYCAARRRRLILVFAIRA